MNKQYDSTKDTLRHIRTVGAFLAEAMGEIGRRIARHDHSKLCDPEKEAFDRETPKLKELTYGSDEYSASLERLGVELKHHYAVNSHHPEHYHGGIDGMDLFDLLEMVADWKAAARRMKGGGDDPNLQLNVERFGIVPQLASILDNTLERWPDLHGPDDGMWSGIDGKDHE